jgi:hypothetical protein
MLKNTVFFHSFWRSAFLADLQKLCDPAYRSGDRRRKRWYLPTSLLKKRRYLLSRLLLKPLFEACTFGRESPLLPIRKLSTPWSNAWTEIQLRVTNHLFACNLPIRRADEQKVGYRFFPIAFFLALSFCNSSLIKYTFVFIFMKMHALSVPRSSKLFLNVKSCMFSW